jgi:uncharacterized glyoxalase superfamily protein PhnB
MPESRSTVMPALRYRNAPGAIDWLCQVFGFERHAVYANPDGTVAHAELTLNGGMIMLGSAKEDEHAQRYRSPDDLNGVETRGVYIVVADADQVHARAVAAGATIKDPEGHSWSAGTYDPWAAHG